MKEKTASNLIDMLCRHLDDLSSKDLNATTLDQVHKLTDTYKNLLKISMLESVDENSYYSQRYYSRDYSGDYGGEHSGARRGQHYVRGHYSRDDEMSRRGYSYADAKEDMIAQLRNIADGADAKDRDMIMRCVSQMQNA
jgi:hypothetical protein